VAQRKGSAKVSQKVKSPIVGSAFESKTSEKSIGSRSWTPYSSSINLIYELLSNFTGFTLQ